MSIFQKFSNLAWSLIIIPFIVGIAITFIGRYSKLTDICPLWVIYLISGVLIVWAIIMAITKIREPNKKVEVGVIDYAQYRDFSRYTELSRELYDKAHWKILYPPTPPYAQKIDPSKISIFPNAVCPKENCNTELREDIGRRRHKWICPKCNYQTKNKRTMREVRADVLRIAKSYNWYQ